MEGTLSLVVKPQLENVKSEIEVELLKEEANDDNSNNDDKSSAIILKFVDKNFKALLRSENILVTRLTETQFLLSPKFSCNTDVSNVANEMEAFEFQPSLEALKGSEGNLKCPIHIQFNSPQGASDFAEFTFQEKPSEPHLSQMETTVLQSYFQYYSKLSNQANMLQDGVRTSMYRRAIMSNISDFKGKLIMDVGSGSGILSYFCAQAGAKHVYAVEASSVCEVIHQIKNDNPQLVCIEPIHSTLENLVQSKKIPVQSLDVLVSECIGIFLLNERMMESFLYARDNFLKPGGKLYPNKTRISLAPFSDAALLADMSTRGVFWANRDFYGIDISGCAAMAQAESMKHPIVDYIDPSIIMSAPCSKFFDLETIDSADLENVYLDFDFLITNPCLVHGLAGWFDVHFDGSEESVWFSTSPSSSPTHWFQIRFLFKHPLAVNAGQRIRGVLTMNATKHQSYQVHAIASIVGTPYVVETYLQDLKDPDYRYHTSPLTSYSPASHC